MADRRKVLTSKQMDEYQRHVKNRALLGAGIGAGALGIPAYMVTRSPVIGGIRALKGAAIGGVIGGGIGLVTKRDRKKELSVILGKIINFESITYHETEAERASRKSRVHREKAEEAFKLGGYATAGGIAATTHPYLRWKGTKLTEQLGGYIYRDSPVSHINPIANIGSFIERHPRGVFRGAALAPAAALATAYGLHKVGGWRQDKKVTDQLKRANESRLVRNAVAQGKTQLSVPIGFDATDNIDQLKEHAKKEATKTALETVYEKLLKSEEPIVRRLSSAALDELINFQDTKPRNPSTGEYSGQSEGGPDPNAMATVYKTPQPQSQITAGGVGKAGAAVFGAGALGAIGAQAGKAGWAQSVKMVKRLAAKRKSVLIH